MQMYPKLFSTTAEETKSNIKYSFKKFHFLQTDFKNTSL